MKKEKETKRESFWRGARRGILWGLMTIFCILWAAGIGVQIWRGMMVQAINSLLQAGLIFIIWAMSQRMERMAELIGLLSEQAQKYESVMALIEAMRDAAKKVEEEKKED